jgi:hypothetical protein
LKMVGPNGLEPSTSSVSRMRSNQSELRAYVRTVCHPLRFYRAAGDLGNDGRQGGGALPNGSATRELKTTGDAGMEDGATPEPCLALCSAAVASVNVKCYRHTVSVNR